MSVDIWMITAVISAIGLAGLNIWQKLIVDSVDELTITLQSNLLPLPFFIVFPAFFSFTLQLEVVLLVVLSGFFNALSYYLLAKALKKEDVSVVAPLRALLPVILAFIEPLVFGFSYRSIILIASLASASGLYILLSEDSFFSPFKNLERRGIQYGFLSPLVVVTAVFCDRFAFTVYNTNPLPYAFFLLFTTTSSLLLFFLVKKSSQSFYSSIRPTKQTIPLGLFRGTALLAALYTISITTGTNLTIINQLGLLIPVFVGGFSLNEQYTFRRLLGAICVIIGSLLIVFFA